LIHQNNKFSVCRKEYTNRPIYPRFGVGSYAKGHDRRQSTAARGSDFSGQYDIRVGTHSPRRNHVATGRVAQERHTVVGDAVGYTVRFEDCTSEAYDRPEFSLVRIVNFGTEPRSVTLQMGVCYAKWLPIISYRNMGPSYSMK
jgi:hypothetical protein